MHFSCATDNMVLALESISYSFISFQVIQHTFPCLLTMVRAKGEQMLVSLQRIVLQKYETYQTDAMEMDMAGKQLIAAIWFWLHFGGKME